MKKRKWLGTQKLQIVLDGLGEKRTVSELCNHHQISQSQYYKWRDQLLAQGNKIFDPNPDKTVERIKDENKHLKAIIGDLTVELKKTEKELKWLES